jgi:hypothetical protein
VDCLHYFIKAYLNIENGGDLTADDEDEDEDEEEFEVEVILDSDFSSGTPYYWLKWKGWPDSSNSWEPLYHLENCQELVKEFHSKVEELQ